VPRLGLVRASISCGLLNAGAAYVSCFLLRSLESHDDLRRARWRAGIVIGILGVAWFQGERVLELSDVARYPGRVLYTKQSEYQRIVLTSADSALALHLNGHLQFLSDDEYRYHEALVHPALMLTASHNRILIGGGGDGLAARELLRWQDVQQIVLVDLDPAMTHMAATEPHLLALNQRALHAPRLQVVNSDAMAWLREDPRLFDVQIFDFPDPSHYAIGKLYTREFYELAKARLAPEGVMVIQATSPLFARKSFWCVVETLEQTGFYTLPYHAYLPSFGEWGFVLAARRPLAPPEKLAPLEFRFLSEPTLAALFDFPKDMARVRVRDNRLNNQALVGYYLDEWARWDH
jgi:spermidine synthase